jgi:hypothetical protein
VYRSYINQPSETAQVAQIKELLNPDTPGAEVKIDNSEPAVTQLKYYAQFGVSQD